MDFVVGQLVLFASTYFIPAGTLACDGSTQSVDQWPELAELLGTTFGGDGTTTFGLPDHPVGHDAMADRHAGPGVRQRPVRDGRRGPPDGRAAAGRLEHRRDLGPCDGRTLPINSTQALFALTGTMFGGDGITTFAVPNLPPLGGSISWWIANYGQFPDTSCDPVTPQYPRGQSLAAYIASITYLAYDAKPVVTTAASSCAGGRPLPVNPVDRLFSLLGTGSVATGSSSSPSPTCRSSATSRRPSSSTASSRASEPDPSSHRRDRVTQRAWLCGDGAVVGGVPITSAWSMPDPGTDAAYAKDLDATSTLGGHDNAHRRPARCAR